MLGAYCYEAGQVYLEAILAIAVPALILSGVLGYWIVNDVMQIMIVGNLTMFIVLPAGLLFAICFILFLLLVMSERGSIRKIIL